MDQDNPVSRIANWEFLDEPIYRWAIFFGAMVAISIGWSGIIRFMKD